MAREVEFDLDELDAAMSGFLFIEAFSAWLADREPCYPASYLREASAHEGLPSDGYF